MATRESSRRRWRVTTHLAESDQEFEMFMHAQGEMHDWLARNDRDNSDCGHGSPVQHLARCGALTSSLLAIHVNYLAPGDAELLGSHGTHVVHCPRSHAYFRHQAFPYEALTASGANVCLATDSLASVRQSGKQPIELSLFEEAREFKQRFPSVPAAMILSMLTANPARALGASGALGELSAGAHADVIAIPAVQGEEPVETILQHRGHVTASLIDGRWALPPRD
jgi:cytosine/adenosine deaminase-related metal-dependent hydrolase